MYMRKFLFLPLLALLASCGKNEDCDIVTPQPEDLVSRDIPKIIKFKATNSLRVSCLFCIFKHSPQKTV
ncbi:hypothetical protein DW048_14460 [Phocaeicola vulgatus]|nr:hypothetical protein DW048_14460 [Phocaeicola vulgatus]